MPVVRLNVADLRVESVLVLLLHRREMEDVALGMRSRMMMLLELWLGEGLGGGGLFCCKGSDLSSRTVDQKYNAARIDLRRLLILDSRNKNARSG